MRKVEHLRSIIGIVLAFTLQQFGMLFGIWQWDILVSGCVWYGGVDYGWSHAWSRYADDYFQCFFWHTTVGMAYDTLLAVIYLSTVLPMILLFASIWYWDKPSRKGRQKEHFKALARELGVEEKTIKELIKEIG